MPADHDEAARRIDAVRTGGLASLDLSDLLLREVPDSVADLTTVTSLNLSDNLMRELPPWLAALPLSTLNVGNNRLSALPESLSELHTLTDLDLTLNSYLDLPDWLGNLTGLSTLRLSGNRLLELPESFSALAGLRRLSLDNNDLLAVPAWLPDSLTELKIGDNGRCELPGWLGRLTNLTHLDISGFGLTDFPAWLRGLTNLAWLRAGNNCLAELPDWLAELSGLRDLNFGNNFLTGLPDSLRSLPKITSLYLQLNQLVELPEWLPEWAELRLLWLNKNDFDNLPCWLGDLTGLTDLWADDSRSKSLPTSMRKLEYLQNLSIRNSPLHELPAWLGELPNLKFLDVCDCKLTALPESLAACDLISLRLSGNLLGELPAWVFESPSLKVLNAENCGIIRLPAKSPGQQSLVHLSLSENKLESYPGWLGDYTGLRVLHLAGCGLTAVPEFIGNLRDLGWLDIGSNSIAELPVWFSNLKKLQFIRISSNESGGLLENAPRMELLTAMHARETPIRTFPETLFLSIDLKFLDAQDCQIVEFPQEISQCSKLATIWFGKNIIHSLPDNLDEILSLRDLRLSGNPITALPQSMAGLIRLRSLFLDSCELTALPDWLVDLPKLTELHIADNPLVSPPPEIVASGTESVLEFLRARKEGSAEQWVSKLLVVGEGGVGKTSLVKGLAGEVYDPHEVTTHGINIQQIGFEHPERDNVSMQLSTWDFGGQQIYHATHQFFLTNRSLFVLLWNSRQGWEQGKLRYWLDIISARAPESPVLLVATHTAGRPVDLPIEELRREYPRIVASLSVENSTGDGIGELRDAVAQYAKDLPLMGAEWPTRWLAAADAVRAATEKHVTPQRMFELMAGAGLADETHQRFVARALHELGDILHYAEDDELSQTVVLQPQWANEYISKVLDSKDVDRRQGLLSREHVNTLWSDVDRGMRDHFLGMMDRYDLSYRIDATAGGDVSLVVERLSWNPPEFPAEWDELAESSNEIRVIYRLNTVPPGIPTWFIARSHRFSTGVHWRAGAMLRHNDEQHLALLRADQHRKAVDLTVRGPAPAAFFSVLDDGLNRTLERYPGLRITRQVPCPCRDHEDEPCDQLFRYDDLRKRLARTPPKEHIECHNSGEDVSVYRLLLGLTPSGRSRESLAELKQILERLEGKLDGQVEFGHRMFLKIQQILQKQQETRCPNVFTVTPARRRKVLGASYELRLYCEEPGAWHSLPEDRGRYPITEPVEWLRRFGPYLNGLIKVLKHAAPLAGPVLGVAMEKVDEGLKADCELMKEVVAQMSTQARYKDERGELGGTIEPSAHGDNDADFRTLAAMLNRLDPDQDWGGLSRITTPEGETLFLCAEHAMRYRR